MALGLDETKKKRKKDLAARHALQREEREVPEDIADTGVPSSEGVMAAIADEAAEIVENVASTVETLAEENPFVAPWAASGLKEGAEPAQTPEALRADIESAAKAGLQGARATRERLEARTRESASTATSETSKAMQSWTDFCLSYYSRMNPVAIQLRWMRAGAAWGEAYLEANRQLVQSAQSTMGEMMKLWTSPFKRRD